MPISALALSRWMDGADRLLGWLEWPIRQACRIVLGSVIFAAIAVNFANVVGRYVLGMSLGWTEEVMIMTLNLSIGLFTPPFGLNLFMTQALMCTALRTLYRGVLPFVAVSLIALLIVTFVPALSLVLLPYLG